MFVDTWNTAREWILKHKNHKPVQYTVDKIGSLDIMMLCTECNSCKKIDEVQYNPKSTSNGSIF